MSQSSKGIIDENEEALEEAKQDLKNNKVQELKVLFKEGDDLRKDQVVMQIFKIFDELCLEQNMNLFMTPYKVLASGYKLGYIEFVKNAIDLVKIHKKFSYNCGLSIHNKCLINYLTNKIEDEVYYEREKIRQAIINQDGPDTERNNKTPEEEKNEIREMTEKKFQKYINQFLRSTAGSVVASYILDLGDRHSGNILIQDDDCLLFHIDFGHILGHKKSKFGFKREVEPFIYLEEMHQLINYDYCGDKQVADKNFEDFQEFCCEGFKIARENFVLVYNLLNLLVPANIFELDKESIHKTIKNFHLELSDNEAKYEMRQMIKKAHKVYRRQFDNWFRLHCDWTKKMGSRWYCCWFRGLKKIFKKKKKSKVVEIEEEEKGLMVKTNKNNVQK